MIMVTIGYGATCHHSDLHGELHKGQIIGSYSWVWLLVNHNFKKPATGQLDNKLGVLNCLPWDIEGRNRSKKKLILCVKQMECVFSMVRCFTRFGTFTKDCILPLREAYQNSIREKRNFLKQGF